MLRWKRVSELCMLYLKCVCCALSILHGRALDPYRNRDNVQQCRSVRSKILHAVLNDLHLHIEDAFDSSSC